MSNPASHAPEPPVSGGAHGSACPKGSRSGLSFDQLHALARTERMEWGMAEPLYFHAAKCGRKCDGTCNGLDGLHIAEDADDVITGGWKDDGVTWCMVCRHRRPSGPEAMLCNQCRREVVRAMTDETPNDQTQQPPGTGTKDNE